MHATRSNRTTTPRNLAWGKTGHMTIGYCAAGLVDDPDLARFLKANQASLGVSNPEPMKDRQGPPASASFVPLADVADLVWRTSRPQDEANHFCDIDESDARVHEGRSLIELCLADPASIDVDFWLDFDRQMDRIKPNFTPGRKGGPPVLRPRRGALPFRVWQMYLCMISSLRAGDLTRYLAAGGTMAHYVGDACQPLHCSWLHHGSDPADHAVHADYETVMVDRFIKQLVAGVDKVAVKTSREELIGGAGIAAARAMLVLMNCTLQSAAGDRGRLAKFQGPGSLPPDVGATRHAHDRRDRRGRTRHGGALGQRLAGGPPPILGDRTARNDSAGATERPLR
jgi:hypothetical protein